MSEAEDQLGAILGNPEIMQKIMSIAQSMGQPDSGGTSPKASGDAEKQKDPPKVPTSGGPDMAMLQAMASLAGKSGIDANQRALLKALSPYISRERIHKLERAMHAAQMAQQASALLNAQAMQKQKAGEGHV